MIKQKSYFVLLALSFFTWACEPEKLERGKEMAVEAERHKVKRITQEDMEKQALLAGDTIIRLVEGAFLQLAESQPKEQALFVAQPDKLPTVNSILQRYNATLTRQAFSSENEAKQFLTQNQLLSEAGKPVPHVELQVREGLFQYQRPIEIRRRNCASCDEPSLLDYTSSTLDQLRVFSAQGQPDGFEEGQVRGVWTISFPRKKIIEHITLKTKPSRRGRGGFFGSKPDSAKSQ
ncbi:hypothetical protein [Rufibacter hautae]|uniref:DUF3365 domain-containing protein n=1 Tax=Rufibacter hautae TaxID=2595005 RepID=A0A5B6TLY7_9BACT|nr:hypothetical protein [Rufibacter hautae]KAA3440439.1 hypothetical protein FOA19_07240 [Rufibacter hautae]